MVEIISNEQKIALAKKAAGVMQMSMAGIPGDVQLEAVLVLVKAQFMASVKPEHRLGLFNSVMARMKAEIRLDLEKRKAANGKKS